MNQPGALDHLAALILLVVGGIGGGTLLLLGLQMAIGSKAWIGVGYAAVFGGIAAVALLVGMGPDVAGPITGTQAAIAILALLAVFANLAIGAFFGGGQLVTSWPHNEEVHFQPFERAASATSSFAWVFGIGGGAVAFLFAVGVYFGVTPEIKDLSKDMNMSNLSKHADTAPAPAPAPKPDSK